MIRHGELRLTKTAAVISLTITMIELPFGALLVASIGAPTLLAAGLLAALLAAVAMSAIAVRADEENRVAALTKAKPLPQNCFTMNHRHASSQAALDNGTGQRYWSRASLKPALFGFTCRMVAEHGTLPLQRQGSIYSRP